MKMTNMTMEDVDRMCALAKHGRENAFLDSVAALKAEWTEDGEAVNEEVLVTAIRFVKTLEPLWAASNTPLPWISRVSETRLIVAFDANGYRFDASVESGRRVIGLSVIEHNPPKVKEAT